jgi:cytochrome b561
MPVKSTSSRYGGVAILIHWTSALAVVLAFAAGLAMANAADPMRQAAILPIHITFASLVIVLTLLRIAWWLFADKRPALPAGQPRWQRAVARLTHGAIYAVILIMATSGIAMVVASGALEQVFAGGPLPDLSALPPRIAHGVLSRLLLALLVLHIGAALYHQFIRRDRQLARMGIGAG